MTQRHLQPDEIDQLLDDEVGLGTAPLRAHLSECATCQAQLERAQRVLRVLEATPRMSPSHRFTDQVMSDVSVLVPWHVAARETLISVMPRSRPARVGAAVIATASAALISIALLWLLTETDVLIFVSTLAGSRIRAMLVDAGGALVVALFGRQALTVFLQSGAIGLAAVLLGFVGATIGALAALRAIAVAAARRREL